MTGKSSSREMLERSFLPLLAGKPYSGIVMGVVQGTRQAVYALGCSGNPKQQDLDGDTIFEIGSVTKLMTATLLAQMVIEDQVQLDDPISGLLPAFVQSPDHRRRRKITLGDLAMHRSGLPRLSSYLRRTPFSNPYADFDAARLYQFLSRHRLWHKPGTHYEYSNIGAGLLGHLLVEKLGMSFEQAITQKICHPLQMRDTTVVVPACKHHRFAHGGNRKGISVQNWDFQALAGCGALRSTANDLMKFLSANMELRECPIAAALELAQSVRKTTGKRNSSVALGWYVLRGGQHQEIFIHAGRTAGFASWIGFNKQREAGVAVLSNRGDLYGRLAGASQDLLKKLGQE